MEYTWPFPFLHWIGRSIISLGQFEMWEWLTCVLCDTTYAEDLGPHFRKYLIAWQYCFSDY